MANTRNSDNGNRGNQGNTQGGRGFASMSEEELREVSSRGGKAAHQSGNANQFDSESGRAAGQRGGQARQGNSDRNEGMNQSDMMNQ